jgi:hypothetical protein
MMRKSLLLLLTSICLIKTINAQQNTKIGGFANIDYTVAEKGKNSFGIGELDNFITSEISDRFSFLSEVVFKYDGDFGMDIERVILKAEVTDWLNIKAGKFHNPIGFWNNAYHHGTLLQPTILRPLAVRFEDEDGPLPIHSTGLWLSGNNISKLNFGYDIAISNGIGRNSYLTDENNYKAITVACHIKPISNLEIGVSSYFDKQYKGEVNFNGDTLIGNTGINQGAAHVAYLGKQFEVISEYHFINNQVNNLNSTFQSNSHAAFIYAGYRATNKITPYVVYDKMQFAKNDSYFFKNSTDKYTLGLRYEFNYLANLKLELSHQEFQIGKSKDQAQISFSIGF